MTNSEAMQILRNTTVSVPQSPQRRVTMARNTPKPLVPDPPIESIAKVADLKLSQEIVSPPSVTPIHTDSRTVIANDALDTNREAVPAQPGPADTEESTLSHCTHLLGQLDQLDRHNQALIGKIHSRDLIFIPRILEVERQVNRCQQAVLDLLDYIKKSDPHRCYQAHIHDDFCLSNSKVLG